MVRWAPGGLTGVCIATGLCLLCASLASAGPKNQREYCVRGSPDNTPWDWEIRAPGSGPVMASDAGLQVSAAGSTDDLRDTFVDSINAAAGLPPWIFAGALTPPLTAPCDAGAGDRGFYIAAQDDYDLWVEDQGSGMLVQVVPGVLNAVQFNPEIFLVPEPGAPIMLLAGAVELSILSRRRRRRG